MRPVIRVSLNGRALQLEDDAHALLAGYLDAARRTLDGNPDREEILADLELAIAEKGERLLVGGREVLDHAQVAQLIEAVGPVEPVTSGASAGAAGATGAASTAAAGDASTGASATPGVTPGSAPGVATTAGPHRLRQVSDGAIVSGLCNGFAQWISVDVTIVRIVAVILAFATGGIALPVYLLLMFIVPFDDGPGARLPTGGLPKMTRSLVERVRGPSTGFGGAADGRRTQD